MERVEIIRTDGDEKQIAVPKRQSQPLSDGKSKERAQSDGAAGAASQR